MKIKGTYFPDEVLVKQLVSKPDMKLFGELYDRYSKKVYNKCYTLIKEKSQIDDLTQEIFIKAFTQLGSFRYQSSFSTWLYKITYNECISFIRKNGKKSIWSSIDEIVDHITFAYNYEEENDLPPVISELDVNQLMLLLENIPQNEKVILLMKYQDGLSLKEISEILQLSLSAVKMRIKRAKAKLLKVQKLQIREEVRSFDSFTSREYSI